MVSLVLGFRLATDGLLLAAGAGSEEAAQAEERPPAQAKAAAEPAASPRPDRR
jgi:hypothetical protein